MMQTIQVDSAPAVLAGLDIEVSASCNLKCAGCRRTTENIDDGRGRRTMTLSTFSSIMEHTPPFKSLVFTGEGEPTLNRDLPEMIKMARNVKKNIVIALVSNLHAKKPEYYIKLAKAGLNRLVISVDSFNQEYADVLRYGTRVDKLKSRLRELSNKTEIPVSIAIAVGKVNHTDVFDTLTELNEIGKFNVMLAEYMDKGKPEWCLSYDDKMTLISKVNERRCEYENLGISLPFYANYIGKKCARPYTRPAVNVDGYLTPCCASFNEQIYNYSSIAESSWNELWADVGVYSWMRDFDSDKGAAEELCELCILNPLRCLGMKAVGDVK